MKMERPSDFIDLYQFSLGGIAYCVNHMRGELVELGNDELVEVADRAVEKHRKARSLAYDWNQQKQRDPLRREGTASLDNRIDGTLSSLLGAAEILADLEAETEQKRVAEEFVEDLFPSGVYPITSMKFADQFVAVTELLDRLEGPYAEHVEVMNVGPIVEQLEELNGQFGAKLEQVSETLAYDEVETAKVKAEDAFHELVALAIGGYARDMETLNRVMAPVLEQTERTRRHLRGRGSIPEVDPETGEPVEPEGGGGSGESET